MAQLYTTSAARIGQLNGKILKRIIPMEVLGITGQHEPMPKNRGDTIVYKRYLPYGGVDNQWLADGGDDEFVAAHLTAEGVTPAPDTITSTTVTAVLQEYAALYSYTNKVSELHEDDVPADMIKQTADRLNLVREMVRYGALKVCTNVFYGGTGSSIATVNGAITEAMLRRIERGLLASHAKFVTEILSPSPNFGTSAIQPAFLVFCHTDVIADLEGLSGYKHVSEYGSRKPVHAYERGSWGSFRFVPCPELVPYAAGGVVVGTTGLLADDSTNIDVYPMIITGEDAWGSVALRGEEAVDANHEPASRRSKADMLGQRGYVGARIWFDAEILNSSWMAVGLVGVDDLT